MKLGPAPEASITGHESACRARQTVLHADQAILHLFWNDLQIEEIDTVELQALLETVKAELEYRTK